jgi:integrase
VAWVRKRVRQKGTVYLAGYTDPTGAQRSAGTFRTRSEAERAAHAAERKVEEGKWLDRNAGKVLFRDFVEQQWWPSQHHLELTTKAAYRNNLDKHFLPFLGAYPMTSVTPSIVQGWVNHAVDLKLSPRSIRKYHTLLHGIFKAAVRDRVIAFNPCEGTVSPKVVLARRETITPEQFESLLAAIPVQHQVLLRVGIETGMRWGELAALRPRHVDVASQALTVAETIVEISKKDSPTGERYTLKPYPKNDRQRILKITPELATLLDERIQSLGLVRDDLLFPSTPRDLRQPTSRNTFRTRVWQPALKTAGLPKTLRMHDLRHAHASWLLAGGADLKTVMDRLGHSQITTTQRYLHALESADDTALEAFQRTRDRDRPRPIAQSSDVLPPVELARPDLPGI